MTKVYYEEDANPAAIRGATVAILGYGNQGSAQARNLRDSGLNAQIASRPCVPLCGLAPLDRMVFPIK